MGELRRARKGWVKYVVGGVFLIVVAGSLLLLPGGVSSSPRRLYRRSVWLNSEIRTSDRVIKARKKLDKKLEETEAKYPSGTRVTSYLMKRIMREQSQAMREQSQALGLGAILTLHGRISSLRLTILKRF